MLLPRLLVFGRMPLASDQFLFQPVLQIVRTMRWFHTASLPAHVLSANCPQASQSLSTAPHSLPHKTTPQTTLSCLYVTTVMGLCYWYNPQDAQRVIREFEREEHIR